MQEYDVPTPDADLRGIVVDVQGDVWFYEANTRKIGRFTPAAKTFREYPIDAPTIASTGVRATAGGLMTFDREGNLWFTDANANGIGTLNPESGEITMFSIPTPNSGPLGIAISPSGDVWFAEFFGHKIGRLDRASGRIQEYPTPNKISGPAMVTFDHKDRLWFTEAYAEKIAVFETSIAKAGTSEGIREYAPGRLLSPVGIGVQNDAVWVADHGGSYIVKFVLQNNSLTVYWTSPLEDYPPRSLPNQLLLDQKGMVWFAEHAGNKIARLDSSTNVLTEYVVPTGPRAITLWLAHAPDGNVWFTEWGPNKIGVVNTSRPLPFTVAARNQTLRLQPGQSAEIEVSIQSLRTNTYVSFSLTGMTEAGVKNVTGSFAPSFLAQRRGTILTSNLSLKIGSVKPGTYTLMVRASEDTLIQSVAIVLDIMDSPFPPTIGTIQMVLVTSIAVGVGLGLTEMWRRRLRISERRIRGSPEYLEKRTS